MPAPNVPNRPTVDFPTPAVILDTVQMERSSSWVGNYSPIEPGTPFSPTEHTVKQASDYTGSIFLGQKAGEDAEFQQRVWGKIPSTQDIYNYEIDYEAEGNAFPVFRRRYLELRDTYAPRTKSQPFTGLFAIKVTASGSGYVQSLVTVSISDTGGGTGATAIAILNATTGAVAKITLKSEGSGYGTGTITVTINANGAGSGATASAIVQAPGCVLVEEKTTRAPDYWDALYILVSRVYKTLPGPVLSTAKTTEFGPALTTVQDVSATTTLTTSGSTIDAQAAAKSTVESQISATNYETFPTGWVYGYHMDPNDDIGARVQKRVNANGTQGTKFYLGTVAITNATVANPCVLTLAAPIPTMDANVKIALKTGEPIIIAGDSNTTPSINGQWAATVIDPTHISIPVNVTGVAGSGFGTAGMAAAVFVDVQELSDRQAIEMWSQVDGSTLTGANKTWSSSGNYSWPSVLTALDTFADSGATGTSLTGSWPIPTQLTWVFGNNAGAEVGVRVARFTGETLVSIARTFSINPIVPDAFLQIITRNGEIVIEETALTTHNAWSIGTSTNGLETSYNSSVRYKTTTISDLLTNGFSSGTLATNVELKLDPSSPVNFTPNSTFISTSEVKPGRLDLYYRDTVTVTVPASFPS